MKKSMWMAACAVCAVSLVASAAINFTVVVDPVDGAANVARTVEIYGEFDAADGGAGLALFGLNLTVSDSASDLGAMLDLDAPTGMASFDRNDGLTNPPGPGNSGYGGTPAGATLLQIGGGQNTIGNTAPPVYPVGTVLEGVATAGPVLLATGTMDVSGLADGAYTLDISASFANMLDAGQSGPVYTVTPAETTDGSAGFNVGRSVVDVTEIFSMATHDGVEEGIQIYPAWLNLGASYNCEPRFMTTGYKLEIALSDVIADASGITVTATNTATGAISGTVSLDPAGDKLIATFATLADAKIYTVDVAGDAVNDFQCEFVVLIGNLTNAGLTANTVDSFDKSLLISRLGMQVSDVGPIYDIARVIPSTDGTIDSFDKTMLISRLGGAAN